MSVVRQWIRFLTVGAAGMVLTLVIVVAAHEFAELSERVSVAIALACTFTYHFFANALWVFRANAGWRTLLRYVVSAAAFRFFEFAFFTVMFALVDLYYAVAVAAALVCSIVVKFFVYRSYVFRSPRVDAQGSREHPSKQHTVVGGRDVRVAN
ncbi:MAG: hypothetical protein F4X98_01580 [Gammaproteobacteria bacterium]|nr:hypothetical protein [Gammaproteobacteria bacterium]